MTGRRLFSRKIPYVQTVLLVTIYIDVDDSASCSRIAPFSIKAIFNKIFLCVCDSQSTSFQPYRDGSSWVEPVLSR